MTTQSVKENNSMEDKNARAHSIFEDPAIAAAAKDDPVIRFISENWKSIIGGLIAIGLSMIAYNSFKSTAEHKRAAATQTLMEIQQAYKAVIAKQQEIVTLNREIPTQTDPKKKEELQQKIDATTKELDQLRDRTKLVVDSLKSPKPFDMLAQLYRGLVAARFGDYSTTRDVLTSTPWESIGAPDSAERMAAEFAVLGLSRALADAPDFTEPAKDALSNLASNGNYAAAQAALTFATVASTTDEKKEARKLLDDASKRFPTQEKFLAPTRDQLPVE